MENDEVTLVVETTIVLSKKKLSEMSDYFKLMFNGGFIEKNKSVIKLKGVSARSLEHIRHFVKNGTIEEVPEGCSLAEEMVALLEAANMLLLTKIQERCSKILLDILDVDNAIPILDFASSRDLNDLIRKARAIALWNFDDVSKLDAFCKLSASQVEGLVSDRALHCQTGERGVWEAIDRWIHYSEGRVMNLPKLVQCLHLDSLKTLDLRHMADSESVKACPMVLKAVRQVIGERESLWEESGERSEESEEAEKFLEKWRTTERRKLPYVPALPGVMRSFGLGLLRFSETERKFLPAISLSYENFRKCKMISSGSKVYLWGAKMKNPKGVWMYDLIQKKWTFLCKVPTGITDVRSADYFYVIGNGLYFISYDKSNFMKLNLDDKNWTTCTPVPESWSFGCVFRNDFYVFSLDYQKLYQYNPSQDAWITLQKRIDFDPLKFAIANEEFIFLFERMGGVYKFNPTDTSKEMELLGTLKYTPWSGACLIEDHIYSFSQFLAQWFSCEKMNIRTGERTDVVKLQSLDSMYLILESNFDYCIPLLWY